MSSTRNWQCDVCGKHNTGAAECPEWGDLPPQPRPANRPSGGLRLPPTCFEGQGQTLPSISVAFPGLVCNETGSHSHSSPGPRQFSQSQQRLDGNRESLATQTTPGQANPNRRMPPRGRPRGASRRTRSASPRRPRQSSASSSRRERYRERSGSPPIPRPPPALPKTPENRPRRSPLPAALQPLPVTPEARARRSQTPSPSLRTSSVPRQSQLPREGPPSPSLSPPRPLDQTQATVNKSLGGEYALAVEKDHQQYKGLGRRKKETRKACDECEKKHRQCTFQEGADQCDQCFGRRLQCLIKGKRVKPGDPPRREDSGRRPRDGDDERDEDRRGQVGQLFNGDDQGRD